MLIDTGAGAGLVAAALIIVVIALCLIAACRKIAS
jgi:hypothetical protein